MSSYKILKYFLIRESSCLFFSRQSHTLSLPHSSTLHRSRRLVPSPSALPRPTAAPPVVSSHGFLLLSHPFLSLSSLNFSLSLSQNLVAPSLQVPRTSGRRYFFRHRPATSRPTPVSVL